MTMNKIVIAAACAGISAAATAGTVDAYSQDFETFNPAEFTSSAQVTVFGGLFDHFERTNIANGPSHEYQNTTGSFFSGLGLLAYTGESTVTTRSIDISNLNNLQFAVDLAAGNTMLGSFGMNTMDIEYQIDGGSWTSLMEVRAIGLPVLFGSNEAPGGGPIFNVFTTFSSDIADLGNLLTVRATWFSNGGFGDFIGLDNILITGNEIAVVPVPTAAFAGLGMLAGLGAYRRMRR